MMKWFNERIVRNGNLVSITSSAELNVVLTPLSDFKVTTKLPGLDFDIGTSYAGNINVQRAQHPKNSLFFWGFESQNGSLTADVGELMDRPWAVWLQGGCVLCSLCPQRKRK
jgi:hypothetical protein